jgi:hypothetical protein
MIWKMLFLLNLKYSKNIPTLYIISNDMISLGRQKTEEILDKGIIR